MAEPRDRQDPRGGKRPETGGPDIPDAPESPPREPGDPPDTDGVQGDEGGGEYRGRPEPVRRRARG